MASFYLNVELPEAFVASDAYLRLPAPYNDIRTGVLHATRDDNPMASQSYGPKLHLPPFLACVIVLVVSLPLEADEALSGSPKGTREIEPESLRADSIVKLVNRCEIGAPIRKLGLAPRGTHVVVHSGEIVPGAHGPGKLSVWDLKSRERTGKPRPFPLGASLLNYPRAKLYRWRGLQEWDIATDARQTLDIAPDPTFSLPIGISRSDRFVAVYSRWPLGVREGTRSRV